MATHHDPWPRKQTSEANLEAALGARTIDDPRLAELWQCAVDKQHYFDSCMATVQTLRARVDEICSEILQGNNASKIQQARVLTVGLLLARQELVRANRQLDESIRQLRHAHARQRTNAAGSSDMATRDSWFAAAEHRPGRRPE
jgi:hypothetical protein